MKITIDEEEQEGISTIGVGISKQHLIVQHGLRDIQSNAAFGLKNLCPLSWWLVGVAEYNQY